MTQKWCTPAQEEFLEHWYVRYQEMKYDKKRALFKEFWVSLKKEWTQQFGWDAEDAANAGGAPSLEKVSAHKCI